MGAAGVSVEILFVDTEVCWAVQVLVINSACVTNIRKYTVCLMLFIYHHHRHHLIVMSVSI